MNLKSNFNGQSRVLDSTEKPEEHIYKKTADRFFLVKLHALNLGRRGYSTDAIPSVREQRDLFSFPDIQLCVD